MYGKIKLLEQRTAQNPMKPISQLVEGSFLLMQVVDFLNHLLDKGRKESEPARLFPGNRGGEARFIP